MPERVVGPASQRFVLRSELPFRALAIAAVAAVGGAVVVVLQQVFGWSVVALVIGIVLLGFAMVVTVAAVLADRRWRQTVVLGEDSVTVDDQRERRALAWSEIKQVTLRGDELLLITADGPALEVTNPHGPTERAFSALLAELTARLDLDRGYSPP